MATGDIHVGYLSSTDPEIADYLDMMESKGWDVDWDEI